MQRSCRALPSNEHLGSAARPPGEPHLLIKDLFSPVKSVFEASWAGPYRVPRWDFRLYTRVQALAEATTQKATEVFGLMRCLG